MEQTHTTSPDYPSQFDILVIGSGAAGLYASLCLPSHLQVGLVTKGSLNSGSSRWAQGGIAAAIYPPDSPHSHLEDTLQAGMGLCEPEAVQFLVENATTAIESLVEFGVDFDRNNQKLAMTLEAAHSHARVLHSRDTTGRAIVDVLMAKVLERPNIQVFSQGIALNLWLHPQTGHCQGICLLYHNQVRWIQAGAVILATGGGGQVFAKTTNPAVSTGDGIALAWRAGAILRDLEFIQFHPTALMKPGAPHFLISEAVRGEGAHLVDEQGYRFAFDYHRSGELAPRNVVSRAIFTHLQKTAAHPAEAHVYLDMRTIKPTQIRHRFPNIIQVCEQWGIDVFHEMIPVAPAAHYWMGGIACDLNCHSSIPGLYVIGETASTGVHGANRLASNSLLECLVFAAQLSKIDVKLNGFQAKSQELLQVQGNWNEQIEIIDLIQRKLPVLMWENAGICRHEAALEGAIEMVKSWKQELEALEISQYLRSLSPQKTIQFESTEATQCLKRTAETLNLLDVGYLILKSAAFRCESRGGHYRSDYPNSLSHWQTHTVVQGDDWHRSTLNLNQSQC